MKKIFAVNAGSSSLKFQLLEMPEEEVITSGIVEKIGLKESIFTIVVNGKKVTTYLEVKTHKDAVNVVLDALKKHNIINDVKEIKGVGHRVVQGGSIFNKTEVVTEKVAQQVEELAEFAPLHNLANINGYRAFSAILPDVVHTVVFDTAFHQTMEEDEFLFPLPYKYYTDYKIRRYGAHGTSHQYISSVVEEYLQTKKYKLISCHLGSGASLCAIKDGKCVLTSMGFTPLGGIMMGTRCGDIDPSVIPYIMKKENLTADEMNRIMNFESGLKGVSLVSSDMREVDDAIEKGSKEALIAKKLYVNRVAQMIGSYYVELGGCDALVLTAGVGEHSLTTRKMLFPKIAEALGIEVDESKAIDFGKGVLISTPNSKIKVFIIPTNEELMIARDTYKLVLENEK